MKKVLVPIRVSKKTKNFIIFNLIGSQEEWWTIEELKRRFEENKLNIKLEEVKEIVKEFYSKGLLKTSIENDGRGLVYKWVD